MFKYLQALKLEWWQVAIYEISMVSLGLLIGARFYYIFENWVVFFLILFLAGGLYIGRLWWVQNKK